MISVLNVGLSQVTVVSLQGSRRANAATPQTNNGISHYVLASFRFFRAFRQLVKTLETKRQRGYWTNDNDFDISL